MGFRAKDTAMTPTALRTVAGWTLVPMVLFLLGTPESALLLPDRHEQAVLALPTPPSAWLTMTPIKSKVCDVCQEPLWGK